MNYKKNRKRNFIFGLLALLFVSFVTPVCTTPLQVNVEAATVKLNVKKKTLTVGKTCTLKVKNTEKTVKWSSSNKRVAKVSSDGTVTAKRAGQATITAKVGKKKLQCVITVKEKKLNEVDQVIALVNEERKKAGVEPLTKNTYLTAAAKVRAGELAQSFSHTRPNGKSCFTAVNSQYRYSTLGENIAYGYRTPASVMEGWMGSQGHMQNILSSGYKHIGVAVYERNGVKYWVQVFGSQR